MDGFLNLIIEVWNQDFLGISIGNVVISLIIIVTSLILRALIIQLTRSLDNKSLTDFTTVEKGPIIW